MEWIKSDVVLASRTNGGLDIGSLAALNLAPLQKWKQRFLNTDNLLWVKVIKWLYGPNGVFVVLDILDLTIGLAFWFLILNF